MKSGALIPLVHAERALFDAARSSRDAWLNWPARVAPMLAAELGVEPDEVLRLLTPLVRNGHEELGNVGSV